MIHLEGREASKAIKSCDTCKHDEAFGCPSFIHDRCENYSEWEQADKSKGKALEQEPCEDAISRRAVLNKIKEVCFSREQEWVDFRVSQGSNGQRDFLINYIKQLPPVTQKSETVTEFADRCRECGAKYGKLLKQEPKTEQFAKWVASEIFDEWEYNKDTFAEIACRKLEKLGIVRAKGDEWELVEPQESEG